MAQAHYETIRLARETRRATLTLSRPDALNAITVQMLEELDAALVELCADPELGVVVLTGAGRAFSAGVDLKALGERKLEAGTVGDLLDLPARRVIERIQTLRPIVIAKVNGACFTGALEIALACDLIVAAEEAKFGDTHTKWGLRPTWGMSQRLPRAVGPAVARMLSYTSRVFSGKDAFAWGLACQAVPRAELDAAVAALAEEILTNSIDANAAYKDLYRASALKPLAEGLVYEAETKYPISDTQVRLAKF